MDVENIESTTGMPTVLARTHRRLWPRAGKFVGGVYERCEALAGQDVRERCRTLRAMTESTGTLIFTTLQRALQLASQR